MSSGLEIFLPRHPQFDTEYGHMSVQRNVEELSRMFRQGTAQGQLAVWDTSKRAWVAALLVTIDPTTGTITFIGGTVTDDFLRARISSDSQFRFILDADGKMWWGPGNATQDVNLFRGAADLLKTEDEFEIAAAGGKDTLRLTSVAADTGLTLGGDTNLYRGGTSLLYTDDAVHILGSSGKNTLHLESTDPDTGITIGDVNLYRSAASLLKTDDEVEIGIGGGKDTLRLTSTSADTGLTIGGDTTLFRPGANRLATDDDFEAPNTARALDRETTMNDIVSTATETDLYSFTVPANTLGTERTVHMIIHGDYKNDTGSDKNLTLRIKFGGTTVWGDLVTLNAAASRGPFTVEVWLTNLGATNSQHVHGLVHFGSKVGGSVAGLGTLNAGQWFANEVSQSADPAKDTTANQILVVTAQHSVSNANLSIRRHVGHVELV